MRYDNVGFFWEDLPTKVGRDFNRPMPEIPDTGWVAPKEFPNLSTAKVLAIDTETYDPYLKTEGPGWGRGKGHLVGFSIAVPGASWYFPIRHEVEKETNLDPEKTLMWLAEVVKMPVPKVGANLVYDIGWLREEGLQPAGPYYDIQYAEALLNSETPNVSLEALSETHLGLGKETSLLYQWCADYYGGQATDRQRANIYRAPPRLVGPYGEADAHLPLAIMEKQWPLLDQRGALDLFNMECGLIELLIEMRLKGAPVDVTAAEAYRDQLVLEIAEYHKELKRIVGFEVNPAAADSLKKAFDSLGLKYPKTAKGNPSFTASVLDKIDHPVPNLIREIRQREKIRGTFIESYILKNEINGRVHCQFHPLKGDENGARSGRFASSDPNLQNIPVRSELGRRIRNIFVATQGGRWRKIDYSQIEYRMLAHHAVGQGAEEIRRRYNKDPNTDYHEATRDMILGLTSIELERGPTKTINFGLIYGMSQKELQRRLGLSPADGARLFKAYHQAVPFAKATAQAASDQAQQDGYISTILGRRSDFPFWGPAAFDLEAKALPFDEALLKYGRIQRAFTHKALNRKLQGGAADIMKKAMVEAYRSGIFDRTGIPLLTVHDELDFDDHTDPDDPVWKELINIMETCIPAMTVPVVADVSVRPRWGECD